MSIHFIIIPKDYLQLPLYSAVAYITLWGMRLSLSMSKMVLQRYKHTGVREQTVSILDCMVEVHMMRMGDVKDDKSL